MKGGVPYSLKRAPHVMAVMRALRRGRLARSVRVFSWFRSIVRSAVINSVV